MKTVKASLLAPGDKYHDLILRSLDKHGNLEWVTMRTLVVVRNIQTTATLTIPSCNYVVSKDDDTGEEVVNFHHPDETVVLKPKPGKWQQIWKLLRK